MPFELLQMNVDQDESVSQTIDAIRRKAGRLDVVVNNAGFGYAGAVEDTSIEEAKAQFETNFYGVLRVCQAVLPLMREQGAGLIVNVSSIAGRIGLPFQGLYSAAKFAVEGLSEALRMEVRSFGVHVVLVEPGDFQTAFTSRRLLTERSERPAYATAFSRALAVIVHDETHGFKPDAFARKIEGIIKRRSPRLRYTVGSFSNRLAAVLKSVLPGRLFEWIIRDHYKV
jgi:NAD(P)-dependent dehydrogenase (short-subunit alcohol dehydrogenase family)